MKKKSVPVYIAVLSAFFSLLTGIATGGYWIGCQVSESQKDREFLEQKFKALELSIKESVHDLQVTQATIIKQCCSELYVKNNNKQIQN